MKNRLRLVNAFYLSQSTTNFEEARLISPRIVSSSLMTSTSWFAAILPVADNFSESAKSFRASVMVY